MNKNSRISIRRLFSNNKFNYCFSFLCAFVFWLVITINQNPQIEMTFASVPIVLSTEGTNAGDIGLGIVTDDYVKTASVTVSGPSYIVSSLKADDVKVTADMTDVIKPGEYTLKLIATRNGNKSGYNISVFPETVKLTFDYIDTANFTVEGEVLSVKAESGLIVDTPIVTVGDSSSVTVTGARTDMQKISKVVASCVVDKTLSETATYPAELKILDENGAELDKTKFTISADEVKITVPICRKKELPVKVKFTNTPLGLTDGLPYSLNMETVTVIGSPEVVDAMDSAPLEALDLTSVAPDNNTFELGFSLPDGIRMLENTEKVTVKVNTSGYVVKTLAIPSSAIEFKNVSPNVSATASSELKSVKVCLPKNLYNTITADKLKASADLSGKSAGEYTVTALIECTASDKVWAVGSYSTTVKLQ